MPGLAHLLHLRVRYQWGERIGQERRKGHVFIAGDKEGGHIEATEHVE